MGSKLMLMIAKQLTAPQNVCLRSSLILNRLLPSCTEKTFPGVADTLRFGSLGFVNTSGSEGSSSNGSVGLTIQLGIGLNSL